MIIIKNTHFTLIFNNFKVINICLLLVKCQIVLIKNEKIVLFFSN